jgi:hypothetical protein
MLLGSSIGTTSGYALHSWVIGTTYVFVADNRKAAVEGKIKV